jgi:hypothetical protein
LSAKLKIVEAAIAVFASQNAGANAQFTSEKIEACAKAWLDKVADQLK